MIDRDFLFWMTEELRRFAAPLELALESPADFTTFLSSYGWLPAPGSFQIEDVRTAFDLTSDLTTATIQFGELLSPNGDVPLDDYLTLLDTFRSIAQKVRRLSTRPSPTGLSATLWTTFASDLLHGLVADYLEVSRPPLFALLIVTGVVREIPIPSDGTPERVAFIRRRVHWERIPQLFTNPTALVADEYDWGAPGGLAFEHLIDRLGRTLALFRLPTEIREPTPVLRDLYYAPGHPDLPRVRELGVHLMAAVGPSNELLEYTLIVLPVPRVGSPSASPTGIVLAPSFALGVEPAGGLWPFSLEFDGVLRNEAGVRIEIDPIGVALAHGGPASTTIDASFALVYDSPNASMLVGSEFSHRLQLHGWRIGVTVSGPVGDPEIVIALDLTGLEVIAIFADGDSFLAELFDGKSKPTAFDAGVLWSSKTGLHFRGAGTLEIVIPVHRRIGPIDLAHAVVGLTPGDDRTTVSVGVSGSGKLGPVTIAISNVGVKAALVPVPEGEPAGVLGDLDVDFGFKFPDGMGLAIETSVASGGGFLEYSEARAEYAGILALDVAGIEVGARGLLTTRLPNGEPGYSFVAVVSSEFTPIQLGLGFTLNGIGGLLGIHRSASIQALRQAMQQSRIDDLLFPTDPIAQAARLISDLRSFFPPTKGRHIVGPAAKIGWGTPPLVEADLALFVELPAPIRIVLLGAIRAALPSQDAALIELNVDVVGLLDFGGKRLEIDAVLSESSHVLGFPITGAAALRLTWGDQPNFAFAIGGFNKRFRPPANFPSLDRVRINIGAETNPRIDIQGYLALTSNTAQLGALAELYAARYGLNIHGWVGFDTLFVFRPFSFVADLTAGVDLRRNGTVLAGVTLDATLSGPRPWRAYGEACLEIWLLPDLCVDFDVDWGSPGAIEAPATEVWPLLEAAIEDPRNWSGGPASASARVVTTAPPVGATAETLVDPMGPVTLRQTVAPLNRKLTKFGESKPSGIDRFDVTGLTVGTSSPAFVPVKDFFARAQFEQLSQDERLTRDSFEKMDAGIQLSSRELTAGSALGKEIVCEERVLDSHNDTRPVGPFRPPLAYQLAALELSAAARSPLRTTGPRKFAPRPGRRPQVVLDDERFVVATVAELAARADIATPASHADIRQALAHHLDANPGDRDRLQIVPLHEVTVSP